MQIFNPVLNGTGSEENARIRVVDRDVIQMQRRHESSSAAARGDINRESRRRSDGRVHVDGHVPDRFPEVILSGGRAGNIGIDNKIAGGVRRARDLDEGLTLSVADNLTWC